MAKTISGILISIALLTMPATAQVYDCVIVGGGLSGLTSAWLLRDLDIVVYEKQSEVGGRARIDTWEEYHYSNGATVMGKPDGNVKALTENLFLATVPVPNSHFGILVGKKLKSSNWYKRWTKEDQSEYTHFLSQIKYDLASIQENRDEVYIDQGDLGTYLDDFSLPDGVYQFIYDHFERLWNVTPPSVSAYYGLYELDWQLPEIHPTSNQSPFWMCSLGVGQISQKMYQHLRSKVKARHTVTQISRYQDHFEVTLETNTKAIQTVKARAVIVATPAPVAATLAGPILNPTTRSALESVSYSSQTVINIFLKKPFRSKRSIVWTENVVPYYRIDYTDQFAYAAFKKTRHKHGIITAYATGNQDDLSDFELLENALDFLGKIHPKIEKRKIGSMIHHHQYAYPIFTPGYLDVQTKLRHLPSGLFLAGDYLIYPSVEGAIDSGYEAAEQVKQYLGLL